MPGAQSSLADDIPTASQSTLLLQKKKEMAEVQQQLDRKKEEFRMRMQRCQEKEVELAAKQEALKEQVRKFEKFLKENDAKRVRANRKAQEEIKLREQKQAEKLSRGGAKRSRCGTCAGCRADNCGKCSIQVAVV